MHTRLQQLVLCIWVVFPFFRCNTLVPLHASRLHQLVPLLLNSCCEKHYLLASILFLRQESCSQSIIDPAWIAHPYALTVLLMPGEQARTLPVDLDFGLHLFLGARLWVLQADENFSIVLRSSRTGTCDVASGYYH